MANLKLNKLSDELMQVADSGKMSIKGIKISQSDYNELWEIGKSILYNEIAYTVNSNCMKILEKLKFIVNKNQIGWEIKRK